MKREHVLCRGRGLHSSPGASLAFSLSSSLGFSFSLSVSSMQGAVGVSENLLLGEGRIEKFLVSKVAQSCPTLCNPVDCSLPGSSVHEILQARILEWVAISFSKRSC